MTASILILRSVYLFLVVFYLFIPGYAQEISLVDDEKIWAGIISEGHKMPVKSDFDFNYFANNRGNQIQPLLLSNNGLYVWSEEPFRFTILKNKLIISENAGEVFYGRSGSTLRDSRKFASTNFFPSSSSTPDEIMFSAPQYNTWIELTYNQNQQDVLKYAHSIIQNGLPPGILIIDDTWQEDYGKWDFHPKRFSNPVAMIEELHTLGFKVMWWICPFVSPDQAIIVRQIMQGKGLLLKKTHDSEKWENAREPFIIKWWNVYSGVLDFTNPHAVEWFNNQLNYLISHYKIDGFKFDGGDTDFYPVDAITFNRVTPNEHCKLYAHFGLKYQLNEFRACWKMAGQPLGQRLHDKYHTWDDLQLLIPQMITANLVGYTFICPDMIGGGDYVSFLNLENYDEELIVRSAQCQALMPMMQFSVAPWRILNLTNFIALKKAVKIRQKFTDLILERVKLSAQSGEPIIANLEYFFPDQGFEEIKDQFMLGEKLMVTPMVQKGYSREIILPEGNWIADDGKHYSRGRYVINVPIDRLPYFKLEN